MINVLAVFWLLSGGAAYDYLPAEQCQAVKTMTRNQGRVTLELSDGRTLAADLVECLPICVDDVWFEMHHRPTS